MKPGLYIVATPIGNMQDITLRALEVLQNSNIILCEDTRVTGKLLAKHQISNKMLVYNDHSDHKIRQIIAERLADGEVVSLVSDAGTPLISDPGYKLVRDLQNAGHYIEVIPGACSAIAALTISGLATDKFIFLGFLPKTSQAQQKLFQEYAGINATLIFFETSKRLLASLENAVRVLGNREGAVCREVTKFFQEAKREYLTNLVKYYQTYPPKGEIVLLISGKPAIDATEDSLKQNIAELIATGATARDIATTLSQNSSHRKSFIYSLVNEMFEKRR